MTHVVPWLTIVGINEDGAASLCPDALAAIATATLVVGGQRHIALMQEHITGEVLLWPSPPHAAIAQIMAQQGNNVCVLATGDPFYYGIGATLARVICATQMRVFAAPSIFSQVAARLGWALQDTVKIAFTGRPLARLVPHLQPNTNIIALSADATTPQALAQLLTARGLGHVELQIFEHLGGTRERIRSIAAADFNLTDIATLNCVALHIERTATAACLPLCSGLATDWFEHDGQMTKPAIRAVTLAALAPRAGELLWDVGLGSGSVAIEWLLAHPRTRAIGFEKNAERAQRAARNAQALGVPHLDIRQGDALALLAHAPQPDAIFIGGGGAQPHMIDTAWQALPTGGRLVMNAVSLETEAVLLAAYKQYGGALMRLSVEHADPISPVMTGWRPAMTITQWRVVRA